MTSHRLVSFLCAATRRIPAARLCALAALLAGAPAVPAAAQQVTASSQTAPGAMSRLISYYRQVEEELVSSGRLRQDRRGHQIDADTLGANFMAIAMRGEYRMGGGGLTRSGHALPLRRWEEPVRLGVHFGPSVQAAQQRSDLATVRGVADRLEAATGHPIAVTANTPNFHVLIVSDAERTGLAPTLRRLMPGISRGAVRAVTAMRQNTFCMVIAQPAQEPTRGYVRAIAVVRAEHPPLMRRSCIEEELAQGMGLANDSPEAWPSIFNDDEEFGVLTRHDELLLRMLYHDALTPGMRAREVEAVLPQLTRAVLGRG